jgi:WD40 repeat protein
MHYIPEVNCLITASVDCSVKFIDIARGMEVIKTFTGHAGHTKIGINAFSWSSVGKYIVSGSDRLLLFWDPYTLEIMNRNDTLRLFLIMYLSSLLL